MDDPTHPWVQEIDDPDAWLRDVRSWFAEQRAKYGKDWEDTDPPGFSDYERSRGIIPPDTPIPSEQKRKAAGQK